MRKFAICLLAIIIGIIAADRLGSAAMRWAFHHSRDVLAPKLCQLETGISDYVVLMGASRCHHHYVPSIIADSLGMSVYNMGIGGANNIYSHYIVLCHLVQHHAPRVVALEVMPTDYCVQADAFAVVSFFAPLFGQCEAADSIYRLAGNHWRYRLSHLYRYNAKAPSILWGLVLDRQQGDDRGYNPLRRPGQHPQAVVDEETVNTIDIMKLHYLERFADLCRQHHIRLVWMVSPKFTKVSATHYDELRRFADAHGIAFLDYHTPGLYLDHPEYFKDASHLWDEGARQFSQRFASDLKRWMGKN